MNNKKEPSVKLPYEKPRLRTINLVADEVLGVKCKTALGDPTGKRNQGGCGVVSCMTVGS